MELHDIKSIQDLKYYLQNNCSPEVIDIVNKAISFYADPCLKADGKKDLVSRKARMVLGYANTITDKTVISHELAQALKNWVLSPMHGRKFLRDPYFYQVFPDNVDPLIEVKRILGYLRGD